MIKRLIVLAAVLLVSGAAGLLTATPALAITPDLIKSYEGDSGLTLAQCPTVGKYAKFTTEHDGCYILTSDFQLQGHGIYWIKVGGNDSLCLTADTSTEGRIVTETCRSPAVDNQLWGDLFCGGPFGDLYDIQSIYWGTWLEQYGANGVGLDTNQKQNNCLDVGDNAWTMLQQS